MWRATEEVRESNYRKRKLRLLWTLRDQLRVVNERIEILERELDSLAWKPRTIKSNRPRGYPASVVQALLALDPTARAEAIIQMAAKEGIDRKSVYRKLSRHSVEWAFRNRENVLQASKPDEEPRHIRRTIVRMMD